jgi:lipopolysaccharide export LptBFGC system permease protein LptF
MGLGQMMLSVLAMALLGSVLLMMNNTTLDSGTSVEATEYVIMASSLGVSQMESALGKAFDEHTVSSDISSTASLTNVLGKESTETEATFDDFDDYNGFTKTIVGDSIFFRSASYVIRDSVDYVTISSNKVVPSASRTYHKRLRVWVSSPYMRDTLTFSTVYSYWYFR